MLSNLRTVGQLIRKSQTGYTVRACARVKCQNLRLGEDADLNPHAFLQLKRPMHGTTPNITLSPLASGQNGSVGT